MANRFHFTCHLQLTAVDVWNVWESIWNKFQSHTWALWGRMSWWFSHIRSSLGWKVAGLHITCSSEQWSSNSPSDPSGEFLPVPCPGPIPDQLHQELWEWLRCQYFWESSEVSVRSRFEDHTAAFLSRLFSNFAANRRNLFKVCCA